MFVLGSDGEAARQFLDLYSDSCAEEEGGRTEGQRGVERVGEAISREQTL